MWRAAMWCGGGVAVVWRWCAVVCDGVVCDGVRLRCCDGGVAATWRAVVRRWVRCVAHSSSGLHASVRRCSCARHGCAEPLRCGEKVVEISTTQHACGTKLRRGRMLRGRGEGEGE
eukprot:5359540-Prymnesium_polylepis.1